MKNCWKEINARAIIWGNTVCIIITLSVYSIHNSTCKILIDCNKFNVTHDVIFLLFIGRSEWKRRKSQLLHWYFCPFYIYTACPLTINNWLIKKVWFSPHNQMNASILKNNSKSPCFIYHSRVINNSLSFKRIFITFVLLPDQAANYT